MDHYLYLNVTDQAKIINVKGEAKGLITGKTYKDEVLISPFEVEFIEISH